MPRVSCPCPCPSLRCPPYPPVPATLDDPRLVATIFAPSDSAFERTLRDGGGTEEALLQNKSLLASLISYHVVPGRAFKVGASGRVGGQGVGGHCCLALLPCTSSCS